MEGSDEYKAVFLYKKFAEMENANGMYNIGHLYQHGIGVEQDEHEAFIWYKKSADMGDSNGMFQVGQCYYLGIGVEKDEYKAFIYYKKSAEEGNSKGIFKTALCYRYEIGVEKDLDTFNFEKSVEWLEKDGLDAATFVERCSLSFSETLWPFPEPHNSRDPDNGKCTHCNLYNTNPAWCQTCDPDLTTQGWTSRDVDIDDCIREFQLRSFTYEKVIEWIPFDRLINIKEIGKGGLGSVYSATWLDGIRKIDRQFKFFGQYVKSRELSNTVALKTLSNSKDSSYFLDRFKNHVKCRMMGSTFAVYGLTRNPKTNEYLMVFQYANGGSLHKFLGLYFREFAWGHKLSLLYKILLELFRIHKTGCVHADLHSGNILIDRFSGFFSARVEPYIADHGLSKKEDWHSSKGNIYGVMPYIAPEVLLGQQFTSASDIYSIGIIMVEMSTGHKPFDGYPFDTNLAINICNGLRPEFTFGTPNSYIDLANKCMNSDPQQRPTAQDLFWEFMRLIGTCYGTSEIGKQFSDADKIINTLPIISEKHPDFMYTSKIINTYEISNAFKANSIS